MVRLLRICSAEDSFEKRLEELKSEFLIPRNYHNKIIESQYSRIRNLPGMNYLERRKNSLVKKEKKKKDNSRIISPLDYNPLLPNISEVLQKHHRSMLFKKPELREVFSGPPMASLRQPPNLRSLSSNLPEDQRFKGVVTGRLQYMLPIRSSSHEEDFWTCDRIST